MSYSQSLHIPGPLATSIVGAADELVSSEGTRTTGVACHTENMRIIVSGGNHKH